MYASEELVGDSGGGWPLTTVWDFQKKKKKKTNNAEVSKSRRKSMSDFVCY
jgi:hypothetical protein